MLININNVDFSSNSGPNSFASRLATQLSAAGHTITKEKNADVQLSFITITENTTKKIFLRLDGIYFNTQQDFISMNAPIRESFKNAYGVIYQTQFNHDLIEKYFGRHINTAIIRNGTDLKTIEKIPAIKHEIIDKYESVWSCASSWRPHKRLSENIRYFQEHAGRDDCLIVAGKNANFDGINDKRILYVGDVNWETLISIYKRSKFFIHLAWLDHCPNVVVDARAAGCKIICTDSGGTKEIAGLDAKLINDEKWDFEPHDLYKPSKLDFSKFNNNTYDSNIDIVDVANKYIHFLKS